MGTPNGPASSPRVPTRSNDSRPLLAESVPSENIARELTFSTDGAQLSLLPCKRRGGSCGLRVAIPVPAPAADELGPWRRLS